MLSIVALVQVIAFAGTLFDDFLRTVKLYVEK